MKRLLEISVVLLALALAFIAYGGPIYSVSSTGLAGTDVYACAPARTGYQPSLEYVNILSAVATADILVFQGDNSKTLYANAGAKAAGATTLTVADCDGFDNGDRIAFQRNTGTIWADIMASCNDTTDLMTLTVGMGEAITSTEYANVNNRWTLYELKEVWSLPNVGTDRLEFHGAPVLAGTKSFPLCIETSDEAAANVELFTVGYR